MPITLSNVDRFSFFFHSQTQQWLCNELIIKDPRHLKCIYTQSCKTLVFKIDLISMLINTSCSLFVIIIPAYKQDYCIFRHLKRFDYISCNITLSFLINSASCYRWCLQCQGRVWLLKPRFVHAYPPFPFGRICFVVLVMRKGGESSWSRPWYLGCTSEVSFSMCTATRTSSYSPVGPSVFYI